MNSFIKRYQRLCMSKLLKVKVFYRNITQLIVFIVFIGVARFSYNCNYSQHKCEHAVQLCQHHKTIICMLQHLESCIKMTLTLLLNRIIPAHDKYSYLLKFFAYFVMACIHKLKAKCSIDHAASVLCSFPFENIMNVILS